MSIETKNTVTIVTFIPLLVWICHLLQIKRIRIGHDGANFGSGWFLDEVRIDIPSNGEQYVFACHRWLDKSEGDGETEIEMGPSFKEEREKSRSLLFLLWKILCMK